MSHHEADPSQPTELSTEELEAQEAERLPDREVMSVVSTEPPIVDPMPPEGYWPPPEEPAPPAETA